MERRRREADRRHLLARPPGEQRLQHWCEHRNVSAVNNDRVLQQKRRHELDIRLLTRVDRLDRLGEISRDRLLAKDVLACGGTRFDLLCMKR